MADDRARKFVWEAGDLRVVTADGRRVTVAAYLAELDAEAGDA